MTMSHNNKDTASAIERAIDKTFAYCERQSLLFAEWIDLNGIRETKHEWRCSLDGFKAIHTTEDMFKLFKEEIKKIH